MAWVDLGEIMRDGIDPPEMLVDALLYVARHHVLMSEPGEGKTLLALGIIGPLLEAGKTVVYLDEENGAQTPASRSTSATARTRLRPGARQRHSLTPYSTRNPTSSCSTRSQISRPPQASMRTTTPR